MASKKKRSTKTKRAKTAKPKRAAGKARKAGKQRSCPHCGKAGFNSRSHPKHLPRGERGK